MLIKDKDITSYQLLLIKQDRVLVLASLTSFFDYTVVNMEFFFFLLFEKNGSVGRWETKHFIRMAFGFLCHLGEERDCRFQWRSEL